MIAAKMAAVVVGALVLQVCLFARFSFEGARPDVMVLVAVIAALVAGPERGAIVGFASGLAFDVLLSTPFGLSALVYTLIAWVVGSMAADVVRTSWWISPVVAGVGSAAAMVLYALIGAVVGQPTLSVAPLTAIVVVVALLNAALAPLAARVLRWANAGHTDTARLVLWNR